MTPAHQPDYPLLTQRLLLRPLLDHDADALSVYRSQPEICRYVPFEPMDSDAIRTRLGGPLSRTRLDAEGDAIVIGIEDLATGALVGDLTLIWSSQRHQRAEIGYVLNPNYNHRGYATEAAHRLLHLAFDDFGFHRVVARIVAGNDSPIQVARRLGMRQEAHLVEHEWFKGAWIDEMSFAILEKEWRLHHEGHACRDF